MKARELRGHIQAFREFNEAKVLAVRTIKGYTRTLHRFRRWFSGEYGDRESVTGRRIRGFLAYKHSEGNSPSTVKTYWACLHSFFAFLVLDEIITPEENPMRLVKVPRSPAPEIHPLTNEQTHALLDAFNKGDPPQHRNYVMCSLMLDSGLRVGEVVSLTFSDIDLDQGKVKVMGKGGKPRTVYIGQTMRRLLKRYLQHGRPGLRLDKCESIDTLFPPGKGSSRETLNTEYVSALVTQHMDKVGIPRNNSSCHRLRHTFAVSFLRRGGSAFHLQALLGHSSLEMTQRYVRLADGDLQEAHRKASPLDALEL